MGQTQGMVWAYLATSSPPPLVTLKQVLTCRVLVFFPAWVFCHIFLEEVLIRAAVDHPCWFLSASPLALIFCLCSLSTGLLSCRCVVRRTTGGSGLGIVGHEWDINLGLIGYERNLGLEPINHEWGRTDMVHAAPYRLV